MKYREDGSVDWGTMWESFCVLAQEGGPPHRSTMLHAPDGADPESAGYRFAAAEIIRGIHEVSGLSASAAEPGWIAIRCHSAGMARWLHEAIEQECVQARADGALLFVPVGEHYALKGEIKNVITVVAKTTHYWREHLPPEVKSALAVQVRIAQITARLKGWMRRA